MSVSDLRREEKLLRIEERREERRLKTARKRDPDPDYGTLRGRYREEIYGRYSPPFEADHWALIDDPEGILTDRERWPSSLYPEVAYESVRVWAARTFSEFADELPFAQWSAEGPAFGRMVWPFPLGNEARRALVEKRNLAAKAAGLPPIRPPPLPEMPGIPDNAYAFLVLRIPVGASHVTMFGLAHPAEEGDEADIPGDRPFILGESTFAVAATHPYDDEPGSDGARMKKLIGYARRFWGRFTGVRYRGSMEGRPPGIRTYEEELFRQEMPRIYKEMKSRLGRPPTATEVYHEMGISKTTWYEYRKHWHFAFPPDE